MKTAPPPARPAHPPGSVRFIKVVVLNEHPHPWLAGKAVRVCDRNGNPDPLYTLYIEPTHLLNSK